MHAQDVKQEERMASVSRAKDKWLWLAQVVSRYTNPLYIAPPLLLVVAAADASGPIHALLSWIVAIVGVSVAPYMFVRWGVRRGRYSDFHVSRREQRLVPLTLGVVCIGCSMLLLVWMNAPAALIGTLAAIVISFAAALAITQLARWKISLHLIGVTGAVTTLVALFGPPLLALAPLVALVGWSRWKVNAHTPLQAGVGALLAVAVTVGVFHYFGIIGTGG